MCLLQTEADCKVHRFPVPSPWKRLFCKHLGKGRQNRKGNYKDRDFTFIFKACFLGVFLALFL